MEKKSEYFVFVTATVIVGAIVSAMLGFVEVSFERLRSEDILSLFLTVIFVALVIERAVEVYANNRFDPEQNQILLKTSVIRQKLELKEKTLAIELARTTPDEDKIAELRNLIGEAQRDMMAETEVTAPKLEEVRARKATYATSLATILGLAASIVAVRVLGQFLPMDDGKITGALAVVMESGEVMKNTAYFQLMALRFVDVVLTTALLAGGADGIHQIIKRFTDIRSGG